jgi:hypothetical protein
LLLQLPPPTASADPSRRVAATKKSVGNGSGAKAVTLAVLKLMRSTLLVVLAALTLEQPVTLAAHLFFTARMHVLFSAEAVT